jgi:hypothetical protein
MLPSTPFVNLFERVDTRFADWHQEPDSGCLGYGDRHRRTSSAHPALGGYTAGHGVNQRYGRRESTLIGDLVVARDGFATLIHRTIRHHRDSPCIATTSALA